MSKCICFDASIDQNSEILILGSMPGVCSLAHQQYYAHPQNRFWRIIGEIFNNGIVPESYEDKLTLLLANKIALWDVVYSCNREGSLDSNITNEKVHNFGSFLTQYPKIHRICFNGNKAKTSYQRHIGMIFPERINYLSLPSTIPANARWNFDALLTEWRHALS